MDLVPAPGGSASDEPAPQTHTFLFADLAGYTALTEVHGDEHAADAAAEFFANVRTLLAEHEAEEVKAIGDALMVRAGVAVDAARLAERIVCDYGARHRSLGIRVACTRERRCAAATTGSGRRSTSPRGWPMSRGPERCC